MHMIAKPRMRDNLLTYDIIHSFIIWVKDETPIVLNKTARESRRGLGAEILTYHFADAGSSTSGPT